MIVNTFQIDKSNGERLDIYLVEKLHPISRSKIKTYIKGSSILVNGDKVKPGYILQKGDFVKVKIKDNIQNNIPILPEKMKIDVLLDFEYQTNVNTQKTLVEDSFHQIASL